MRTVIATGRMRDHCEAVAAFLAARPDDGDRPSTIDRRLAAITKAHRVAGPETATVAAVVRETRRGPVETSPPPLGGGFGIDQAADRPPLGH